MTLAPSKMLLVTAAILASVVAAELNFGPGEPANAVATTSLPPRRADPLPAPSLVQVSPLDALTETIERPLFFPDRRAPTAQELPASQAAQAKAPTVKSVSGIVLTAVVMTSDARLAFLRDPESGQVRRVTVGERLGTWTVEAIRSDGVTLSNGPRHESIPLRTFQPAPRAARARAARKRTKTRAAQAARQAQSQSTAKPSAAVKETAQGAQPAKAERE